MEGNDSLTVKGGGVKGNSNWGCGIGYYVKGGTDAGTINIRDIANVTATGSSANEGGAAIGGGRKNSADNGIVNIENVGRLNAYGGGKSAAIGAGFWKAADVNIVNSYIENAIGGSTAAGIGSSRNTIEALSSADWLNEDKMSVLTTRINISELHHRQRSRRQERRRHRHRYKRSALGRLLQEPGQRGRLRLQPAEDSDQHHRQLQRHSHGR